MTVTSSPSPALAANEEKSSSEANEVSSPPSSPDTITSPARRPLANAGELPSALTTSTPSPGSQVLEMPKPLLLPALDSCSCLYSSAV